MNVIGQQFHQLSQLTFSKKRRSGKSHMTTFMTFFIGTIKSLTIMSLMQISNCFHVSKLHTLTSDHELRMRIFFQILSKGP